MVSPQPGEMWVFVGREHVLLLRDEGDQEWIWLDVENDELRRTPLSVEWFDGWMLLDRAT